MKVRLSGDICRPGMIEVEVADLDELQDLLVDGKILDEEQEWAILDEQNKCLMFLWDGNIFDENDKELLALLPGTTDDKETD